MVTHRGIEPLLPPWKGGVLTAWPRGHNMELVIGVEPTTCWLQVSCSAIEPHQHIILFFHKKKVATQKGLEPSTSGVTGRHSNQLSYWAIMVETTGIEPVTLCL